SSDVCSSDLPIVGGTIILVVGLALIPVGLNANIFAVHPGGGTLNQNVALAATSASLLILFVTVGLKMGQRGKWLRPCSVLLALIGGCVVGCAWGVLHASAVLSASWLTLSDLALVGLARALS